LKVRLFLDNNIYELMEVRCAPI